MAALILFICFWFLRIISSPVQARCPPPEKSRPGPRRTVCDMRPIREICISYKVYFVFAFASTFGWREGLLPAFNTNRKPVILSNNGWWRRVRDLNPSYAINVNTISSRAPSTTQPTLHGLQRCVVHNENDYNSSFEFCQPYFERKRNFFIHGEKDRRKNKCVLQ